MRPDPTNLIECGSRIVELGLRMKGLRVFHPQHWPKELREIRHELERIQSLADTITAHAQQKGKEKV